MRCIASVGPPETMADIKSLEYPTLKVPYEMLNKKFRTAQKNIDREVTICPLSSCCHLKLIKASR